MVLFKGTIIICPTARLVVISSNVLSLDIYRFLHIQLISGMIQFLIASSIAILIFPFFIPNRFATPSPNAN